MFNLMSLFISLILVSGLSAAGQFSIQVGFWNVENLFDTTNALTTGDDDFTPSGRYEWTESRLVFKYQQLTRVIHDMDRGNDLAILGLAEIENSAVLKRLNQNFIKRNLKIIHKESPDERGIDCALLYNPAKVTLIEKHFIPIFLAGDEKTRDIIEAQFRILKTKNKNKLYVFINHWPSRWGGQDKTDPLRRVTAATLRSRIDEILINNPRADIIILGDLNDHPDDPSVFDILKAGPVSLDAFPGDLVNTTWDLSKSPNLGTIMNHGTWEVLDQIIISYGMLDNLNYHWIAESSKPFHPDYLIETDGKYAGWPFRMYRNGLYQGGYSDHLPILCRINYTEP